MGKINLLRNNRCKMEKQVEAQSQRRRPLRLQKLIKRSGEREREMNVEKLLRDQSLWKTIRHISMQCATIGKKMRLQTVGARYCD